MSTKQVNAAVQALFEAHIGRMVTSPEKDTDVVHTFRIAMLGDKIGTMKSGDKASYVVLERADKPTIVMNLHPNVISKLLKTGAADGGLKLVADGEAPKVEAATEETTETATTEEAPKTPVVEVQPTATTETAAPEATTEVPAEAPKAPSKKERAIACYKAGHKQGKARKDIIAVFRMAEKDGGLGMSAPGANTYYQNIKSGLWS